MIYGEHDFLLEQGSRFDAQLELEQPDGTPLDISGFTPVVNAYRDGLLVLTSDGDDPSIGIVFQPDGTPNAFIFTVLGDATAEMFHPFGGSPNMTYRVDLVDPLVPANTVRVLRGKLVVE